MSSSLKHQARPRWTCLSLISSFQFDCFQSFSPFLFSVPVFLVPERCVLNLLLSLRSPVRPRELLPAVCLELHEPQVVLSALSVGSPLPQGVQWHSHPQWLLSVHQHSTAVTTQTLNGIHRCAGLHYPSWRSKAEANEGQPNLWNQRTRWAVCTVLENLTTLHLKSHLPSFYPALKVCVWVRWSRVVCLPSCYHVLHLLLSHSSAQISPLNNKIHIY